ncbi:MAG TPA: PVC-type heme-binding CxxCH protein [Tepidisphaeraceae bacterium]|jgi:putative heme-binding domain-containing protein|nr:PVC-type heme-binding CxxCH protein [Tepidisphaeraceae bacterium]
MKRFCAFVFVIASVVALVACTQNANADDDAMSNDPAVERRLLELPEGFDLQLYASEPTVINPVTMNFDPQGRLWVLSLPGYPHLLPGQEPRDFITVLDPPDENGRARSSHVFATGLSVPTGMIPGDGGAYVGEADSLLHLKDTDGDGNADQRRVLLSGFGTQDIHHTINTFRWGPDGCLYFNQGCYILSSVETPYGLRRLFGGCIWQLRPDSLQLEINDRSIILNNTWGHVFDEWGRSLISSAWQKDINLVLPDTPLNVSNDPDFVPPLSMTKLAGDRHCGLERISGGNFPPEWEGNLVSGGFESQRVNRFMVEDDGTNLSVRQSSPLVVSHHRKFRPVDVKIGPDGALYIADWYDLIIQHNQVNFRDPRRDHSFGRIWRITYKSRPLAKAPDLGGTTAQVLDHLKDAQQWNRDQARRVLAERDRGEVSAALGKWIEGKSVEHDLLEALWMYQTIDVVEPSLLRQLLRAKDARVRSAATSVLGTWNDRLPDALPLLAAQAQDENVQVRLNAILAAQRIPSAGAFEAALSVLDRPANPMLEFELRKAALVLRPYWYPPFQSGQLTLGGDARRISFALISLRDPSAVPKLLEIFHDGKLPADRQTELLLSVAATGNAQQIATVLDAAVSNEALSVADRAHLLDALADAAGQRKVVAEGNLNSLVPLVTREDAIGLAAMRLAGSCKVEASRARLTQICEEPTTSPERRQAAMNAIVELGGDESRRYLAALAASDKTFAVRADAIVALAAIDLKQGASALARLLHDPTANDIAPLIAAMLRRNGASDAISDAFTENKPTADAAKIALRELTAAGMSSSRLATVLKTSAAVATAKRQTSKEELKRLVGLVVTSGDPARGERLFRSAALGCMRCHAIAGAGGNVGPDLAAIGTTAQPDFLVEHIIQPGKHVKDGYVALAVDTTDGEALVGVQLRETADALVLRDATHDEIVIPKNSIKRKRLVGTLMPSGLADGLTDAELADLVRFLCELGKPGPFNVGHAAVARQWWTLGQVPAVKPENRGKKLQDKKLNWSKQYTNVAGEVPLSEVAIGPGKSVAILRCELEVRVAGKLSLAINGGEGIQLWMDGSSVQPRDTLPLELTVGRHTLDFWVDLKVRKDTSLRCELIEIPDSPARAGWKLISASK